MRRKLDIYKIDTEVEQELSAVFGIRSIPSMLFVPVGAPPMMQAGAIPKEALTEIIHKELLINRSMLNSPNKMFSTKCNINHK